VKPFGSAGAYVARFCWSRRAAPVPAVGAAAGRVLMDKGWIVPFLSIPYDREGVLGISGAQAGPTEASGDWRAGGQVGLAEAAA
jgi:hypothetical protein